MKLKLKPIYLLLLVAILFNSCNTVDKKKDLKPNILFFLVDDQRDDVISCAGHPFVQTPTVDKLAENGIRFTNAFVTTSICAASRASIYTGLYESKHNYTFRQPPIKEEFIKTSYPYLLKKAGYNTGFIGKFDVKMEQQDSMLSEMFDFIRMSPRSTPHFIEMPDGSRRHSAEIKGDQAIEYIKMQSSDVPFCLSVSFNAVHAVDGNLTPGNDGHYPYPDAVADLYEDITMPEPKLSDPEIFENHPDFLKESMNRIRYFWRWDTEEKYQINMKAYFRMISGYDNVMQRVIASLEENGLDKNTIIIYSADNGYYMGDRGFAGKWTHYDESLRVPMIICDLRKKGEESAKTSDKIVLNIDIPATILDYAGISIPEIYQGKSLLPIVENKNIGPWRKSFFCEHRMNIKEIPKYIGIRGERYMYAIYYEQNPPYEFLHDLKSDSDQLKNMVNDPDYKEILEDMREKCKKMEWEIKNK